MSPHTYTLQLHHAYTGLPGQAGAGRGAIAGEVSTGIYLGIYIDRRQYGHHRVAVRGGRRANVRRIVHKGEDSELERRG